MSPIIKICSALRCRHASALLNLLLCIVFVLPLPVTDSAATGTCSVDFAVSGTNPGPAQTKKDHSVPFPCQNRPCGCRSADTCLKKCCCFTADQKVAWAKMHRLRATPETSQTAPRRTTVKDDPPKSHQLWRTVSFVRSMECQGLGIAGVCFIVTLTAPECPPAPHVTGSDYPRLASDTLPTACLQPPVPPPKLFG